MYSHDEETIAAISTPVGEGGIGIIRLSGARAINIVQPLFRGSRLRDLHQAVTHTLYHGYIEHPDRHTVLDEALVTVMRAPRSYTKEDVVEIHCHGGVLALRQVLDVVLAHGARLASPGEFTKRAFLNGRIDLVQAESVIDIIRAKTDAGLQLAVQQLRGRLSARLAPLHQELKRLLASLEAAIDFPEEELEIVSFAHIIRTLTDIASRIAHLLAHAHEGKIVRDGLRVAIVGKPNVGKSSLLNVLLEEERAIVTPVPGTTRDTIEDFINLQGIPLCLIDTAGIRSTEDQVEQLGVARSRQAIARADVLLCLFDASLPWSLEDEQVLEIAAAATKIILLNKTDLPIVLSLQDILSKFSEPPIALSVSMKAHTGINQLKQALLDHVLTVPLDSVEVANSRHKHALIQAQTSLSHALLSAQRKMSPEFIAFDVREALNHLGCITGETTTDDLLDEIFATFCIGK